MIMLKKEVRKLYKKKRDELTPSQKLKWDDLLLIQFQKLSLPPLSTVLSFFPMIDKAEINTFIITDYLKFINPGLQIAYPKTNMLDFSMQALLTDEETEFEENMYQIPEPVNGDLIDPQLLDVVLIPMLAFDKKGNRVGYGKGFYDRFLKECDPDCLKIGLCYFDAIDAIEDAGNYDVPLNYCITPQMVYVF
jgi:5-formyltetrahydrofolate cyclo-ligase